jgi:hypothetical protein
VNEFICQQLSADGTTRDPNPAFQVQVDEADSVEVFGIGLNHGSSITRVIQTTLRHVRRFR